MQLLNTKTLTLEEFIGVHVPEYAILSHTWGTEEVSFQEIHARSPFGVRRKTGYRKIQLCAEQAAKNGFKWLWVDTCCIDKSSSAALSEAINSMYKWYRDAKVCYVYLADVHTDYVEFHSNRQLEKSTWFSRGWTLQELIAPSEMLFFSSSWRPIGTKKSLLPTLSRASGVSPEILLGESTTSVSIAQRMSWAANRETTRVEDMAYCLLGIFNVQMPMLYGEGERAFVRLQEEIMKTSADMSLFAWRYDSSIKQPHTYFTGLLATHPRFFKDCGAVKQSDARKSPYSMTNFGLHIHLPLIRSLEEAEADVYTAVLECHMESSPLGIQLKRISDKTFARVDPDKRIQVYNDPNESEFSEIFVPQEIDHGPRDDLSRTGGIWISKIPDLGRDFSCEVWPKSNWSESKNTLYFSNPTTYSTTEPFAAIVYRPRNYGHTGCALLFGFSNFKSTPSGAKPNGLWGYVTAWERGTWDELRRPVFSISKEVHAHDTRKVPLDQRTDIPEGELVRFVTPLGLPSSTPASAGLFNALLDAEQNQRTSLSVCWARRMVGRRFMVVLAVDDHQSSQLADIMDETDSRCVVM